MSGNAARQSRPRLQQSGLHLSPRKRQLPGILSYHRVALILADAIDCLIATTKGLPPMRAIRAARSGKT
jgi:hypothetical protein